MIDLHVSSFLMNLFIFLNMPLKNNTEYSNVVFVTYHTKIGQHLQQITMVYKYNQKCEPD